jgi:hypothetical protein
MQIFAQAEVPAHQVGVISKKETGCTCMAALHHGCTLCEFTSSTSLSGLFVGCWNQQTAEWYPELQCTATVAWSLNVRSIAQGQPASSELSIHRGSVQCLQPGAHRPSTASSNASPIHLHTTCHACTSDAILCVPAARQISNATSKYWQGASRALKLLSTGVTYATS